MGVCSANMTPFYEVLIICSCTVINVDKCWNDSQSFHTLLPFSPPQGCCYPVSLCNIMRPADKNKHRYTRKQNKTEIASDFDGTRWTTLFKNLWPLASWLAG